MDWLKIPGNEPIFNDLVELLRSEKALAFVGAGASAALHPLWDEFIELLVDKVEASGQANQQELTYWRSRAKSHPIETVTALSRRLGSEQVAKSVHTHFRPRGHSERSFTPIHEALVQLPFRGFVTSNYDVGLSEACAALDPDPHPRPFTWKNPEVSRWLTGDIFDDGTRPILHAHGIYDDPESIVLSSEGYHKAYGPGRPYRQLFKKLWVEGKLVVVGFGFSDPWIGFLGQEVVATSGISRTNTQSHIAIVGLPEGAEGTAHLRRLELQDKYHVDALFYPTRRGEDGHTNHSRLLEVLTTARSACASSPSPASEKDSTRWDLWRPLPEAPEPFHLLNWHVRLTPLVGRSSKLRELVEWAEHGGDAPRFRVVSGLGGVGKSRLAAELCEELGRRGWDARFMTEELPDPQPPSSQSRLWVFDYPEERQRSLNRLIQNIIAAPSTGSGKTRILLLSRHGPGWWRARLDQDHLAHVLDADATVLHSLGEHETVQIFQDVLSRIAEHYESTKPRVPAKIVARWRQRDPHAHSRPLIIVATALHTLLQGKDTLRLDDGSVLRQLARRERARLDAEGTALGLGTGASRLAALAVVAKRVDHELLTELKAPELSLGFPEQAPVERLASKLHMWDGDHISPPTPDVLGVALLLEILEEAPEQSSEWLWAVIRRDAEAGRPDLLDRLGRLLFDAGQVDVRGADYLREKLTIMSENSPQRAMLLEQVATEYRPPYSVLPLTIAVHRQLAEVGTSDDLEQARRLRDLARHLVWAGRHTDALEPIEKAIAALRHLEDAGESGLKEMMADNLRILAKIREDLHQASKAVEASAEEVAFRRELLGDEKSWFDLSGAMINHSIYLRTAVRHEDALKAIQEAVEIAEQLVIQPERPDRRRLYENSLGRALHHLSKCLESTGARSEALVTVQKSIEIRRPLADAEPHRYSQFLLASMKTHVNGLARDDDTSQAFEVFREAIALERELFRSDPMTHGLTLFHDLGAAAALAAKLGIGEEMISLQLEQLETLRLLLDRGVLSSQKVDLATLAMRLAALGNTAYQQGDPAHAVRACDQALTVLGELRRQGRKEWSPRAQLALIGAYLNRGNARRAHGDHSEAIGDYSEALRQSESFRQAHGEDWLNEGLIVLARLNRASKQLDAGRPDRGIEDFDAAVELAVRLRSELEDTWPLPSFEPWAQTLSGLVPKFLELPDRERAQLAMELDIDLRTAIAGQGGAKKRLTLARALALRGHALLGEKEHNLALTMLHRGVSLGEQAFHGLDLRPDACLDDPDLALHLNDLGYSAAMLADLTGRTELLEQAHTWLQVAEEGIDQQEPVFLTYAFQDSKGLVALLRAEAVTDTRLARVAEEHLERARDGLLKLEREAEAAEIEQHLERARAFLEKHVDGS